MNALSTTIRKLPAEAALYFRILGEKQKLNGCEKTNY
jgi:hypothetical protein